MPMEINGTGYAYRQVAPVGTTDVVKSDTAIQANVPSPSVMVRDENDLADLPTYPAGTIAFTAGFKAMWQLDASGDWVSMI